MLLASELNLPDLPAPGHRRSIECPNPTEKPANTENPRRPACRSKTAFLPGKSTLFDGSAAVTENRGVPGSSPGLAIEEPPAKPLVSLSASETPDIPGADCDPPARSTAARAMEDPIWLLWNHRRGALPDWPVKTGVHPPADRLLLLVQTGMRLVVRDDSCLWIVARGCTGTPSPDCHPRSSFGASPPTEAAVSCWRGPPPVAPACVRR